MDLETLQNGLIGKGMTVPGLQVGVPLVYADYVASGRALEQIEAFIATKVLPYYADSHIEASFCGAFTTRLRATAGSEIARLTQAGNRHAVVFVEPYKHGSNILPWRASGARVEELPEAPEKPQTAAWLSGPLSERYATMPERTSRSGAFRLRPM